MKTLLNLTALGIIFISSCNESGNRNVAQLDSLQEVQTDSIIPGNDPMHSKEKINQIKLTDIIGGWASVGMENVTMDIKKDSIYYPELFVSYSFQLTGDSLKIKYDDYVGSFAAKMPDNDTLLLRGEDGEQAYYRFRE